jgi:hypothetical protein
VRCCSIVRIAVALSFTRINEFFAQQCAGSDRPPAVARGFPRRWRGGGTARALGLKAMPIHTVQPMVRVSVLWKIVFWLALVAYGSILFAFADLASISVSEVLDVFLTGIVFVAAFGAIYRKALGSRIVWRVALPVFLVLHLCNSVLLPALGVVPYASDAEYGALGPVEEVLFTLVFAWCLYSYAFRCEDIWAKAQQTLAADASRASRG